MGTVVVVALFAALIAPRFINWNDYRSAFETEAEKILGHPVRVKGEATASILPAPSLTFSDVEVGDPGDAPLMTVRRFSATIELVPLLQGEIHVVSMRIEEPEVRLAFDARGNSPLLTRSDESRGIDPNRVALEAVEVSGGRVIYSDARTGVQKTFQSVQASIDARSLSGPWHIDGSFLDQGQRVPVYVATGLRQDDGTFRVKTEITPPGLPLAVVADGVLNLTGPEGPSYRGTYHFNQVATDTRGAAADVGGWRSDGNFTATLGGVSVESGTLAYGPPERSTTITGSLAVVLGANARFEASLQSRQLDIDRVVGGGPNNPVSVPDVQAQLGTAIAQLPVPPIPGSLSFSVPGIVVGGSLIQDVALTASVSPDGWTVDAFRARLPGQATVEAKGTLESAPFRFKGTGRIVVMQPSTFATWLRGRPQEAARLLPAFDIAGDIDVADTRFAVDKGKAKIGNATLAGTFWLGTTNDKRRTLSTDLNADRIDFDQLKSVADLLLGGNWTNTTGLADSFEVRLAAGGLTFQDFAFKDVAIDARYADDVLTVVRLAAGFDGGAVTVSGGRLENLRTAPHGRIEARLEATSLDVPIRFAQKHLANTGIAGWLQAAGPALAPASLLATLIAPPDNGEGIQFKLKGTAGGTAIDATLTTRQPGDWRNARADVVATLDATTSAGLIRQAGLAAPTVVKDVPGKIVVRAGGVPATGLDATVSGNLGGLTASIAGKIALSDAFIPALTGTVDIASDNLERAVALAGLSIPVSAAGTPAKIAGDFAIGPSGASLKWTDGTIAGQHVAGALAIAPNDRIWRVDGSLNVEEVDLGWLMALGLGFAPTPTGNPNAAWSRTTFSAPTYGPVTGKVALAAGQIVLSDSLEVRNARFDVGLQPQQIDVDMTAGEVAGGTAKGGFSIRNVAGDVALSARFNMTNALLDSLVWRLEGRPVATGKLDLSANFDATGRSPASLVASATGGGALFVSAGEARYLDPAAAATIVRASDLGQQYSEDALRQAFGQVIAANALRFERTDVAFTIAAGALRVRGLTLRTMGLEAVANAVIDFNTLSLDSDWTLTFDAGDTKVPNASPRAGLAFRGALDAPKRTIDVLPLAAYLNTRQQSRMLEIIALEDATRIERERLTRLTRRIAEDETRRLNDARFEALRKASAATTLAAVNRLHDNREAAATRLMVAGLKGYADRLAAEATRAQQAADAARRLIETQRPVVEAAHAALSRATEGESAALAAAEAAAAALADAKAGYDRASAELQTASVPEGTPSVSAESLRAAETVFGEKAVADVRARLAYVNAQLVRAAAQAALDAATAEAARLAEASRNASREAGAKSTAAATARQAAERAASGGLETIMPSAARAG